MSGEATSPLTEPVAVGWPEGHSVHRQVVDGLTRTQIVQYAGASGDFNPIHTDEVFATEVAGRSTVIAHGMLTMGLVGRALTGTIDQTSVLSFGGRFRAPVLPGDSIMVAIERAPAGQGGTAHPDGLHLSLVAINQAGVEVFVGYATVAGSPPVG